MTLGPVQFVAYCSDRIGRFRGQILDELDRLEANGSIRVLNLPLLAGEDNGDLVLRNSTTRAMAATCLRRCWGSNSKQVLEAQAMCRATTRWTGCLRRRS